MLVRITYLLVIVIWATTPLAIKFSGDSLAPIAGLSLRIALAFTLGSLICTVGGYAGLAIRRHWKLYAAASISLFPNMALVYLAAQTISSGLVALLFGLSPLFTAVLARPILGENLLQPRKIFAIAIALAGLACIVFDSATLGEDGYVGVVLMLGSNVLFSGSALWVKKLNAQMAVEPTEQALGAMAFALPGLLLSWVFGFGLEPLVFSATSIASLLYLSVFGSLLGFVAYYFLLKNMAVETVSLIPFITPVMAMCIGVVVADEVISAAMLLGAGLILLALGVHQGFWRRT
ncbi:MAG: DMT family transporter [Zhongshania sp.]|uniref:DMT family transporter n=1 Tax=Zhongshania sp. TaxID=1971902 RepID=UPI00262A996C|nr:DMT family transporter [Zhongshania sp.]MDF1692447.1 DMT family transporter [Zhongshania sp.]